MNRNSINFDNKNIKKSEFYNKDIKIFNIDDIDVNNILVSKKEQYGKHNSFKYFIRYNDNDIIRPLYLFISQTTGYINKFEKNKIAMQQYKDSIITNLYNKKIPEERVQHKCLSIIILESVLYAYEKYYPQTFLEECKYAKEKIKTNNYIDAELESESDIDTDIDNEEIRQ